MNNTQLYEELCEFRSRLHRLFILANSSSTLGDHASECDLKYLGIIRKLGTINLSTFSQHADITRPAATKVIRKLVDAGYIKKTRNTDDKRECFVELSDEAAAVLHHADELFAQILDGKLAVLTAAETQELSRIIHKLLNDNSWETP